MELRNRDGTAVDPIPFLVTASIAFLLLFAFVPGFLLSLGLTVEEALVVTSLAFGGTLAAAYHQLVYDVDPVRRAEIPGPVRFQRLVYVVLVATVTMVLLLILVVTW